MASRFLSNNELIYHQTLSELLVGHVLLENELEFVCPTHGPNFCILSGAGRLGFS